MRADGHGGGWIEFDGQFVTIGRGGLQRLTVGKGTKRIHISQIASVQIKPAGPLVNGFIQIATAGGVERRSKFGRQTPDAVGDENSVVFRRSQQEQFDAMARAIEHGITQIHAPQPVQQGPDVAQQISQMWALVQQGAMTPQEFEAFKARLLGGPVSPGPAPTAPQHPRGWR